MRLQTEGNAPLTAREWQIRTANSEDVAQMANLGVILAGELWDSESAANPSAAGIAASMSAMLRDPVGGVYYVAIDRSGRIVGQLAVKPVLEELKGGVYWYVDNVIVDPAQRRQGVCTELFQAVEQIARDRGAIALRLFVDSSNAARTYRRLGMTEIGAMMELRLRDDP